MGTTGRGRETGPGEAIGRALLATMRERGLAAAEAARRLPPGRGRATLYRLLAGAAGDTKLATLLDACRAVGGSPAEILHRAGLDPRPPRGDDALDAELRRTFARVLALPAPARRIAVARIAGLVEEAERLARDEG